MTPSELIMHCGAFAEEHGVEELLDCLAGIHKAYTEKTPAGSAPRMAYAMCDIDLEDYQQPDPIKVPN